MNRRDFLSTAAGAAALATLSASARGAANDVIRIGVIGVRGRGVSHIHGFRALPGVEVVALCDVDENILGARADEHDKKTGKKKEKAWQSAAAAMEKLGVPKARIDHLLKQQKPELVAELVKELQAKGN